jgi:hypothetical protein
VLISHDLAAVERICDRALLIRAGEVAAMGDTRSIIETYQTMAYSALADVRLPGSDPKRIVTKTVTFAGSVEGSVRTGDPLRCRLVYQALERFDEVVVTVSLNWPSGYLCTQLSSPEGLLLEPGHGEIEFYCPTLTMQRGLYSVDLLIERRGEVLDWRPRCSMLRVGSGKLIAGDFYMEHSCRVR